MEFDPFSSAIQNDPYPTYKMLREQTPIARVPALNAWAAFRHADVKHILTNHKLFSSDPLINIAFSDFNPAPGAPYLLASDPPEHTRLRKLVVSAFSKKFVESIADTIERMINDCLEQVDPRDGFDLIDVLASPLPVTVIADAMGIDASMGPTFRRWSNQITVGSNSTITEEERAAIHRDAADFRAYFIDRIAHARKNPGNDLISALVKQEEGAVLSSDEVMAMCVLLLVAGNETTTSTIGNAIWLLTLHPDQRRLFVENPALAPGMVEEVLRYNAPIQMLFRRATQDTELGGIAIPKDSIVMPIYGSANRDETVFADADTFDIRREDIAQHVAFGAGVHFCVGNALARYEVAVAMRILLQRMPTLVADLPSLEWNDSFYLRGPKQLRVGLA